MCHANATFYFSAEAEHIISPALVSNRGLLKSQIPSLHGICMQTEKHYKVDLFSVNRVINLRIFSICEEAGSKCSESMQLSLPFWAFHTPFSTACKLQLYNLGNIFLFFHFVCEEESLHTVQVMKTNNINKTSPSWRFITACPTTKNLHCTLFIL